MARRHYHRWVRDDAAKCWRCRCGDIVTDEQAKNANKWEIVIPHTPTE